MERIQTMKEILYFWRDLVKRAKLCVNCKTWLHIDCKEKVKLNLFSSSIFVFLCKMFPMLIYQLLCVYVTKRKWIKCTFFFKKKVQMIDNCLLTVDGHHRWQFSRPDEDAAPHCHPRVKLPLDNRGHGHHPAAGACGLVLPKPPEEGRKCPGVLCYSTEVCATHWH